MAARLPAVPITLMAGRPVGEKAVLIAPTLVAALGEQQRQTSRRQDRQGSGGARTAVS